MKGGRLRNKAGRKRIAVVGGDVRLSLSPAMHTAAYRAVGSDLEYCAVCVQAGELGDFLRMQKNSRDGFAALSVTAPLKRELFALGEVPFADRGKRLQNFADERALPQNFAQRVPERAFMQIFARDKLPSALDLAHLAYLTGVANTVLIEQKYGENPDLAGADSLNAENLRIFNTDVYGIGAALLHAGCCLEGRDVSILGAGATAISAVVAAVLLGAKAVRVFARRVDKALVEMRMRFERAASFVSGIERENAEGLMVLRIEDFVTEINPYVLVDTIPGGYAARCACHPEWLLSLDYANERQDNLSKKCDNFIDGKEILFWQGLSQVKLFLNEYANINLDADSDTRGKVLCAMRQALFER